MNSDQIGLILSLSTMVVAVITMAIRSVLKSDCTSVKCGCFECHRNANPEVAESVEV